MTQDDQSGQQPPPPPGGWPPPPPPQQPPPGYVPAQQPYQPAPSAPPGYGYGQPAPQWGAGAQLPPGVVVASTGRRVGAYFLAIPLAIVTLGVGYLIWGLVLWGKGTTPALKVLGMSCWDVETRRPPTFGKMALREIVGRAIVEGICIIVGIVSFFMFIGAERRSIHDKIGGTIVVHDPNKVLG
jgi:uncharacterized RDD family membrane protein YckC